MAKIACINRQWKWGDCSEKVDFELLLQKVRERFAASFTHGASRGEAKNRTFHVSRTATWPSRWLVPCAIISLVEGSVRDTSMFPIQSQLLASTLVRATWCLRLQLRSRQRWKSRCEVHNKRKESSWDCSNLLCTVCVVCSLEIT